MSAPRMTAREWGLLIALSFLWGAAFFFAGVSLKEVTYHGLAFLRVAVAGLALGLATLVLRLPFPKDARLWRELAMLSLFSTAMPFTLLYWAQTHIASGLAAILNAMTPIFTILVAHVFTSDERIDARRLVGVLAGIVGVAVIVGPSAIHFDGDLLAEAAVLGAGCCYAVASVYSRRFKRQSPVVLSFAQMAFAAVFLLAVMLIAGAPLLRVPVPSLTVVAAVLALGVFSTGLAFVMFFRLLATAGATNAILVTLLVPVSAILLGVVILGETTTPRQFAGLALIALGLIINDGRPLEFLRERLSRLRARPVVSGPTGAHMINEPHHSQ
jgi:drug/metabolite transporter (DMT)-like permease